MKVIEISIDGQELTVVNEKEIETVEKSLNYVKIQASFSQEWETLLKTMYFQNPKTGKIYSQLLSEDGSCIVPHEALDSKGYISFAVSGTQGEERITTTKGSFFNRSTVYGGEETDPTPSDIEQLKAYAQQAQMNAQTAQGIAEDIKEKAENGELTGMQGPPGEDYVLTEQDKQEIANEIDMALKTGRTPLDLSNTTVENFVKINDLDKNAGYDIISDGYLGFSFSSTLDKDLKFVRKGSILYIDYDYDIILLCGDGVYYSKFFGNTIWAENEILVSLTSQLQEAFESKADSDDVNKLISDAFPIGSIICFNDEADHSNHLGFNWERCLFGKVPVGYDSNDSDFNVVGKQLGEKNHTLTLEEMPAHTHESENGGSLVGSSHYPATAVSKSDDFHTTLSNGGNQPHNNIQPSEVVAFWKRVS